MDAILTLIAVVAVLIAVAALATARKLRGEPRSAVQANDTAAEADNSLLAAQVASLTEILSTKIDGISSTVDAKLGGVDDKLGGVMTSSNALGEGFGRLRDLVSGVKENAAQQHATIAERLDQTLKGQSKLADVTGDLERSLVGTARGGFGEQLAAEVIQAAGMIEGTHYRAQTKIENGKIPDFTFLLPRDGDPQGCSLHMDVKYPYDNFKKYGSLDAKSDAAEDCLKGFRRDVRTCISQVENYVNTDSGLDCALLYIPNEAVYGFIQQHGYDGEAKRHLFADAMERKVVLCSPSNLYLTLSVIKHAVDSFMREQAAGEILEHLDALEKQWDKCQDELDKLDDQTTTVRNTVDRLTGRRRRGMQRVIDRMKNADGLSDINSTDDDAGGHGTAPATATTGDAAPAGGTSAAANSEVGANGVGSDGAAGSHTAEADIATVETGRARHREPVSESAADLFADGDDLPF